MHKVGFSCFSSLKGRKRKQHAERTCLMLSWQSHPTAWMPTVPAELRQELQGAGTILSSAFPCSQPPLTVLIRIPPSDSPAWVLTLKHAPVTSISREVHKSLSKALLGCFLQFLQEFLCTAPANAIHEHQDTKGWMAGWRHCAHSTPLKFQ